MARPASSHQARLRAKESTWPLVPLAAASCRPGRLEVAVFKAAGFSSSLCAVCSYFSLVAVLTRTIELGSREKADCCQDASNFSQYVLHKPIPMNLQRDWVRYIMTPTRAHYLTDVVSS